MLKSENSGKLLQQRVDNKVFGGELGLVALGHSSLLIHFGKRITSEFMILHLCGQVLLVVIVNVFSIQKARSLSILTPFKMEFSCILILPISNFLDVGKCLPNIISDERQHISDDVPQMELFLVITAEQL